jgi:hypothetical protein
MKIFQHSPFRFALLSLTPPPSPIRVCFFERELRVCLLVFTCILHGEQTQVTIFGMIQRIRTAWFGQSNSGKESASQLELKIEVHLQLHCPQLLQYTFADSCLLCFQLEIY